MFCTLHGIWTVEPTCAIIVVRFSVLKMVLLTVSLCDSSLIVLVLLSLSTFLKSLNTLLLSLMLFLLINSTAFGLAVSLSRSKILVWFCSVFLGIIRKPAEEEQILLVISQAILSIFLILQKSFLFKTYIKTLLIYNQEVSARYSFFARKLFYIIYLQKYMTFQTKFRNINNIIGD